MKVEAASKVQWGDFQTPPELARQCCEVIRETLGQHDVVVEPTCGQGNFLAAAAKLGPRQMLGFERQPAHARAAERRMRELPGIQSRIRCQDFFSIDWNRQRRGIQGRVLFLGNPPWVTNAALGAMASTNLPAKINVAGVPGMEAMTGQSNFDISESILQTLIMAMRPGEDSMAMLVKRATVRKVAQFFWRRERRFAVFCCHQIDAKRHFGASVEACLMMLRLAKPDESSTPSCAWSADLETPARTPGFGWADGHLVSDPGRAMATASLRSHTPTPWRSGVKHDLAAVLELTRCDGVLRSASGRRVDVEPDRVYPLAKGADVANGRSENLARAVLLPQLRMNEATASMQGMLPRTHHYLQANLEAFSARKSSIYRSRDVFAIFGIGQYTFASWKLAICGLYKRLTFTIYGPIAGKPVVLDDTAYALALETQEQAMLIKDLLDSRLARDYFESRIFWDAKRPITATLLRSLDLSAVARRLGRGDEFDRCVGYQPPGQ